MSESAAKFYAYRNLNAGNWSIRRHGKVIHHVCDAFLVGVVFKVSLAGWRRVQEEKRRNVHAYAVAAELILVGTDTFGRLVEQITGHHKTEVTYNPYGPAQFMSDDRAVTQALIAHLTPIGLHAYGITTNGATHGS
jgi:hypothetical protein